MNYIHTLFMPNLKKILVHIVTSLNYMRSGIYFSGFFRGVFLYLINFAGRISEAVMGGAGGGGHYIFLGCRVAFRVRCSSVRCSIAQ
jgi:hypothetical protein